MIKHSEQAQRQPTTVSTHSSIIIIIIIIKERMKAMDPDENEIYKFLGIEQADGIKMKRVFE